MPDSQSAGTGGGRDSPPEGRLSGTRILQFVGALLAAVGVGSLINRVRKRSDMSDSEQRPQRRVTGSRKVADTPEGRGALPGHGSSDVAEEHVAQTEEDAALAAKIAAGHEPSDIKAGRLMMIGVAILVIGGLTSAALYGMFVFLQARPPAAEPPSALGVVQPTPPAPRLQTDPEADWQELQATEQALLHTYGWADKAAGKVRIPIDRAMDLVAQRGLPVAPGSTRQFDDRTPNLDSTGGRGSAATPTPGR